MAKKNKHTNHSKDVGVDRKAAKACRSKKSFKEVAKITFRKHEKSFEKLAE
ncbi:hypothetical protein SAMN05443144_10413 [Fodinibius roseus]|uniref:Uncharacterized protein n=1 Tax=Fodinibius roseus TaxID=1194090 RepID=A0A1M4X3X5_9BACT|nr:hypothetical protein [Fodinibius roseus]SHE88149.1 hypothetical protein SAMN05443144_10413 [Fodinibius roseus]